MKQEIKIFTEVLHIYSQQKMKVVAYDSLSGHYTCKAFDGTLLVCMGKELKII